jgi:hypothetical protein
MLGASPGKRSLLQRNMRNASAVTPLAYGTAAILLQAAAKKQS